MPALFTGCRVWLLKDKSSGIGRKIYRILVGLDADANASSLADAPTHIVTDSWTEELTKSIEEMKKKKKGEVPFVVLPEWASESLKARKRLPEAAFAPDKPPN